MRNPNLLTPLFIAAALSLGAAAHAQAPAAPAAALPTSPAKKQLVAKLLQMQQPGIEAVARGLVEQPAAQLMQNAGIALRSRVAADKREAVGTAIQEDVKKYVDDATPIARASAVKLAPGTIGTLLEEKMTEDELKQVLAILESPAFAKYQRLQPELQTALTAKLVAETRPIIEPKIRTLDQTVARRLGIELPANGAAAQATKPPASKP